MGVVPLFISKRYYINVKDKIWYGISLIGSVLIAVGWYLQSTIVKKISNGTSPEVSTNITNKAGISYFIKHPLPIVRTFIRDVLGSLADFLVQILQILQRLFNMFNILQVLSRNSTSYLYFFIHTCNNSNKN